MNDYEPFGDGMYDEYDYAVGAVPDDAPDDDLGYDDGYEDGRNDALRVIHNRMVKARRLKQRQRGRNQNQKRRDAVLIGLVREVRDLRRQMDRQQRPARPQIIDVGGQYPAPYMGGVPTANGGNTPILLAGLALAAAALVVTVLTLHRE